MDVFMENLIDRNLLPFIFAEDMNLMKLIFNARRLPAYYKPPNYNAVSGPLIDTLYDVNWNSGIRSLFNDCRRFGISFLGYLSTINTVPMVNALDYGVYNPSVFLYVLTAQITVPRVGISTPRTL